MSESRFAFTRTYEYIYYNRFKKSKSHSGPQLQGMWRREEETMEHILCDCNVLAVKRKSLENGYPEPEDYHVQPLNGIVSVIYHVFEVSEKN